VSEELDRLTQKHSFKRKQRKTLSLQSGNSRRKKLYSLLGNSKLQCNFNEEDCEKTFPSIALMGTKNSKALNISRKSKKKFKTTKKFQILRRVRSGRTSLQSDSCVSNTEQRSVVKIGGDVFDNNRFLCSDGLRGHNVQATTSAYSMCTSSDQTKHCGPVEKCFSDSTTIFPHNTDEKYLWCRKSRIRFSQASTLTTHLRSNHGKKLISARSVEKGFQSRTTWLHIFEHTLWKSHTAARSVENRFQIRATWPTICEHTLGKNHIAASSVEKDFPNQATWPHICEHTLEKNVIVVRSVEKVFPMQTPWWHTCDHTLWKKNILLPAVWKSIFTSEHLDHT